MQIKPCIILVIIIALMGSCAPAYIPNVVNSPMLTEKGDMSISAYSGTAGYDIQTAGAITNHIGLMINGSFSDHTNDTLDLEKYHKHQFLEIAPGYFTKIGRKNFVEVYAGYGLGSVRSDFKDNSFVNSVDADISRFFIQPGIGMVNNFVNLGFSSRFTRVTIKQNSIYETAYFAEPAFTVKVGYKWVMACYQIGFALPFEDQNINFDFQPLMMSWGLQFNLGRVIKGN